MLTFSENLSRSELADALGVDRLVILRLEQAGRVPAGIRVRPNRTEFTPAAQMAISDILRQPVEAYPWCSSQNP
jgi:DNA-binding transcriptional regulator LsrR (DeoR family)